MDTFLLIMCICMATAATANDGYNYQQPRPGAGPGSGPTFRPSPSFSNSAPSGQYYQQQSNGPSRGYIPPSVQSLGPSSQYAGGYQQQQQPSYAQNGQYSSGSQYSQQQQRQTILTKNIYIHSAPEETEEFTPNQGAEADPIRKNYRILFIKAPSHNVRINSVKQAQASNEEKTVIYVLSKKPDITHLQSQAVQTVERPQKPEVYFIKYKTQAEANRAQQEIQAQYEALGGSTSVSDEGFAPVTSVIGGGGINGGSGGPSFGGGGSFGGGASFGGGGSFGGPSFSGSSNLLQSASNNVQQSYPGSSGSASSSSFGVAAPNLGYLPVKTNK